MIEFDNLFNNDNLIEIQKLGDIKVLEHQMDLSVTPGTAINSFFAAK